MGPCRRRSPSATSPTTSVPPRSAIASAVSVAVVDDPPSTTRPTRRTPSRRRPCRTGEARARPSSRTTTAAPSRHTWLPMATGRPTRSGRRARATAGRASTIARPATASGRRTRRRARSNSPPTRATCTSRSSPSGTAAAVRATPPSQREGQPVRQVEHCRQCGDHPGDRGGDQAPDHDEPRGGAGEEVGRQRHQRHAAEDRGQERGDRQLGGERHRQRLGHSTGQREAVLDAGRPGDDPRRRRHRQGESDRPDQHGVDEQQDRDRQAQAAEPGELSPAEPVPGCDRRHGRGAEDRRLEPGQQREEAQQAENREEPGHEKEAPEEWSRHDEHERHVLSRDRQQVGEAGGAEVVGGGRRLVPVVTEEDAGEQRGRWSAQRAGTPHDGPSQVVGRATGQVALVVRSDLVDQEPGRDVAHGEVRPVGDRHQPPADLDPLPRQSFGEHVAVRTDRHGQLDPAAAQPGRWPRPRRRRSRDRTPA